MHKPDFRYLVLWLFLFGIIVVVFLQVISGYNIRRLSEGNKNLLKELKLQNSLRKLQADIVLIESDIRGAVITGDKSHLEDIGRTNLMIDEELTEIFKNPQSAGHH